MAGEIEKWDDISKIETQSTTHLEDDIGYGDAAIIRMFEFAANPEAFKRHTPTKQELFNYHAKHIGIMLWSDGLEMIEEINPKVTISKNKKNYRIFIGAKPRRGVNLHETPQTLAQIAHPK